MFRPVWREFLGSLRRRFGLRSRSSESPRRRRLTPRLEVMALENRLVPATVTNPISAFPITVDGQFTGGVVASQIQGEWSDVTPLGFHSPTAADPSPFRASPVGNPATNSLLYADVAPGVGAPADGIYLMYDYLGRTDPTFAPGDFIADVTFPAFLPGATDKTVITVQFRGHTAPSGGGGPSRPASASLASGGGSSFDVFVDTNGDGISDGTPTQIGLDINGAVGFGPSTLSPNNHLLVELEVGLRITPTFADANGDGRQDNGEAFPATGINPTTGQYDPAPQYWGATAAKNAGDPQISSALFQIMSNGMTKASSNKPLVNQVVNIDFKPSDATNTINLGEDGLKNKDKVEVAILSTALFDATTVKVGTVRLRGSNVDSDDGAKPIGFRIADVNGDGINDLVLIFKGEDIKEALNKSTTSVVLTGKTTTGITIGGSDFVNVLSPHHKMHHDGDDGRDDD